jgi:hypothetical protein
MARPKIPIDEGKVEELASLGCSLEEIASLLAEPEVFARPGLGKAAG